MSEYVNNKEFFAAILERKELISRLEGGDEIPRITNYLGECILKIANNLANKGNFNGYSFKDEMICDGIENCIKYFDKFNPAKSSNPFSYYTQIIYFAFLRRIAKEKQQYHLKHKIIQSAGNIVFELQDQDDDAEFVNSYREFLAEYSEAVLPSTTRKVRLPKAIVLTCQTLDIISE